MSMQRLIVWLGVFALGAVTVFYVARKPTAGPPSVEPPRLKFIAGGTSSFWQKTIGGARAAASEHNAELVVFSPENGSEGQLNELQDINAGEIDGLAISPLNPTALTERLSNLAKEVKIVTYDSDAPDSDRLCYIGTNNHSAGRLCARLVKQALPEGGKVVVLFANFDKDNALHRHEGFVEELAYVPNSTDAVASKYEILATLQDNINTSRCAENIKQALKDNEDIDCFVGMFGYHGGVLLNTLNSVDHPDGLKLVVFDDDEKVLQGISDGTVYGTIVQDPYKYGYEAVRMLTTLHAGRTNELPIADRGSLYIPCEIVTQENIVEFRDRLSSRVAQ